jgi:hypothetical protein
VVVFLSVRLHPFVGMAMFVGMMLARRWWWTCIFGLPNAMMILAGFVACAIAAIKILTN